MMSNEVQIANAVSLPANSTSATFSQVGDKNTQVAHANQVIANTNIILLNSGVNPAGGQNQIIAQLQTYLAVRSSEYYNLFIVGGETFDNGRFFVPPDRALTESIDPDLKSQLASLSEPAKARIKTFPSLFMSELDKANTEQIAYYGFVTDVCVQSNGIRIEFQKLGGLPQHRLNEIFRELALDGRPHINELSRTHWTIKRIDLLYELRIAGLNGFGTT